MRKLTSPSEIRPPYMCVLCGNSDSEALVDTLRESTDHYDINRNGSIYLCLQCIDEAAQAAGFVPKALFDALWDEKDSLQMENDILREKHLEDVDAVIAAVKDRLPKPRVARSTS